MEDMEKNRPQAIDWSIIRKSLPSHRMTMTKKPERQRQAAIGINHRGMGLGEALSLLSLRHLRHQPLVEKQPESLPIWPDAFSQIPEERSGRTLVVESVHWPAGRKVGKGRSNNGNLPLPLTRKSCLTKKKLWNHFPGPRSIFKRKMLSVNW